MCQGQTYRKKKSKQPGIKPKAYLYNQGFNYSTSLSNCQGQG